MTTAHHSPHLLAITLPDAEPRRDSPGERRLEGDPQFSIWNLDKSAADTLFAGIWETTPGRWRAAYDGKWEFCTIVQGSLIIIEDGAEPVTYREGDSFVIRDGFRGTWEATEPTRKHYVVHMTPR